MRRNRTVVATTAADVIRPIEPPPIRVKATSVHLNSEGKIRAAGPLSALPFNPHQFPVWPRFCVGFNGEWIQVEKVEAHPDFGWIAEGVASLEAAARAALDIWPRVALHKNT